MLDDLISSACSRCGRTYTEEEIEGSKSESEDEQGRPSPALDLTCPKCGHHEWIVTARYP